MTSFNTSPRSANKWGICATIKAPKAEILSFAGYHLEMGAHRILIYLDDANSTAYSALKAHPKIRVVRCDDAHWRKLNGKRPGKHQIRQTLNATHAYARQTDVEWLIHMDADEFLWSDTPLQDHFAQLGQSVLCARIRPQELLAGQGNTGTAYKAFIPAGRERDNIVKQLYPKYGRFIKGGFLSHVAGKLFVRTGQKSLTVKIHNVVQDGVMNPGETELPNIALCHNHAKSWEDWYAHYRYRLEKGSYRSELAPHGTPSNGGLTMHALFSTLEQDHGIDGVRALFDEVCADTPDLRARLSDKGLLRLCDLELEARKQKHFPE